MNKTTLYALLVLCLGMACKTQQTDYDNLPEPPVSLDNSFQFADSSDLVILDEAPQEKAFVVASIKRTACYGKCPVYEAKVFSNGLVLFEGEKYADKDGLYEAYILEDQIDNLIAQADSIAFFDMAAVYPSKGFKLHDLPSTHIFIKKEEDEKTVVNNHAAPKKLRAYELYFDEFLSGLNWNKVVEEKVSE